MEKSLHNAAADLLHQKLPASNSTIRQGSGQATKNVDGLPPCKFTHCNNSYRFQPSGCDTSAAMVLQDLGRRINAAVTNLTRDQNLDEKVNAQQTDVPKN